MEKTQICITFAGPYDASKSPVAQHLSCTFGWPRFENDVIRKEAKEDGVDESEYTKRVIDRLVHLVEDGCDFVYDASNDRHWLKFLDNFATAPRAYAIGVISFDLSKEFYSKLVASKQYPLTESDIDRYLADHQGFLERHSDVVICTINDNNFSDRLQIAEQAVKDFIAKAC